MKNKRSRPERGATAVEYGLMVTLIAAVIIGAVFTVGGHTFDAFNKPCQELASVGKPC